MFKAIGNFVKTVVKTIIITLVGMFTLIATLAILNMYFLHEALDECESDPSATCEIERQPIDL